MEARPHDPIDSAPSQPVSPQAQSFHSPSSHSPSSHSPSPDWRELLPEGHRGFKSEGPPGEDLDLLVPIEPGWSVLDLTGTLGALSEALVHRGARVTIALSDPALLPAVQARGRQAGFDELSWGAIVADPAHGLEPALGRFHLILAEGTGYLVTPAVPVGEAPFGPSTAAAVGGPGLANLRALLKPGGFLIWKHEGAPLPQPDLSGLHGLLQTAKAATEWARAKAEGPNLWRVQLTRHGFEDARLYVQIREYAWGFLPFDAYWLQRYYLETLQEEGQGSSRGKAQLARLLGQGGAYPFLASAHVLTARNPEELV